MAVDRILEQWTPLQSHFDKLGEEEPAFEKMATYYRIPIYQLYMQFISYALSLVTNINKEFQTERPAIHLLHKRMATFFKTLLSNYMKLEYLNSTPICMIVPDHPTKMKSNLDEVYAGPKAEVALTTFNISKSDRIKFRQKILSYYVELCKQIR